MHALYFSGLIALAHLWPEPFLVLGFIMGISLGFVAPFTASPTLTRWVLGAFYAAFLAVLFLSSSAARLSVPDLVVILPGCLLIRDLAGWVGNEACAARVHWLLLVRHRRERAVLWRALRDLLPEYAVLDFGKGVPLQAHKQQVVLLRAKLADFFAFFHAPAPGSGSSDGGGGDARESVVAHGSAVIQALHQLVALWDREVARPPPHPPHLCRRACARRSSTPLRFAFGRRDHIRELNRRKRSSVRVCVEVWGGEVHSGRHSRCFM
jgi:hypothetical protein